MCLLQKVDYVADKAHALSLALSFTTSESFYQNIQFKVNSLTTLNMLCLGYVSNKPVNMKCNDKKNSWIGIGWSVIFTLRKHKNAISIILLCGHLFSVLAFFKVKHHVLPS